MPVATDPVPSLTGRVERVYTTERQPGVLTSDMLYAIDLRVTGVNLVEGAKDGERVFVTTWQSRPRPERPDQGIGVLIIPEVGDVTRFRVSRPQPSFEVDDRQGIEIVLPGTTRSESLGLPLRLIEPGEFVMGSAPKESGAQAGEAAHRVLLSQAFYLGVYEVTQFEFEQVMQHKPSAFAVGGTSRDKVRKVVTERFPVENVSWFDAVEFCNRLSQKDGFPLDYELAPSAAEGGAQTERQVRILGGSGYRLPSEAEWEYACRAGTLTPFHLGIRGGLKPANCQAIVSFGTYGDPPTWKSLGRTAKVGSYPPNAWGLFDMHGNVAEWCEDWYRDQWDPEGKGAETTRDPHGPPAGTHRVLRGGSWLLQDKQCRSASRMFHTPGETKYYGGFRIARTPTP
ncbi:MAG: formylglycine-generating enzyme family protein [Planctomycetaceae bacterium]